MRGPVLAESIGELACFEVRFEAQMSFQLADIAIQAENSRFVPIAAAQPRTIW